MNNIYSELTNKLNGEFIDVNLFKAILFLGAMTENGTKKPYALKTASNYYNVTQTIIKQTIKKYDILITYQAQKNAQYLKGLEIGIAEEVKSRIERDK